MFVYVYIWSRLTGILSWCLFASGDCVYYKLTGFAESSSSFKLTVSGSSPGSFDVGHSVLCSVFNASSVFQYCCLLLLLWFASSVISQISYTVLENKCYCSLCSNSFNSCLTGFLWSFSGLGWVAKTEENLLFTTMLSMFGHIARMDDDADAKMILMAPPPDNWKRPPGRPCITWLNTVQRDLRTYNLTLNEAVDLAQNRPLCRLMSTYGTAHS